VCVPGPPPGGQPGALPGVLPGAAGALASVQAGLGFLAGAQVADWPAAALADWLRAFGQLEAAQVAAQARVLAAFSAQAGFEADGQATAKTWLRWQTQVTTGAAGGAVGWMRRLAVHPRAGAALEAGQVSVSFARLICDWSDLLPPDMRDQADQILLAAAVGGATQADLAMLAQQMYERSAPPDPDEDDGPGGDDDGFGDRRVGLDVHFRGAGKLDGDLTPECTAALAALFESLGKKAGPEDTRTEDQRRHDALEEGCRRLIGGGLPDTAGQPTQVQLHMTLDQLRGLPGAADAERSFAAARAAGDGTPGWVYSRAAAAGYACDAHLIPVVTGHLDPAALDAATDRYLAGFRRPDCPCGPCACPPRPGAGDRAAGPAPLSPPTRRRLQDTLLACAADILSGPAGLAAFLRTSLLAGDYPASVSLPLDTGTPTPTVPPHLRRLVILRDRHCAAPGCRQRPAACQVHHITPRSQGGPTRLPNLLLLCSFHHLTAIHRWGWTITLHPDGTTTMTSPDKRKTFHSHGPPNAVAA
jgi:hypothetical protein